MLTTEQEESVYRVKYTNYVIPLIFLSIPPLLLFEHWPGLLDGSIKSGELVGLILGILLPLVAAYFLFELASFEFSIEHNLLSWRWRNLLKSNSGEVPLGRIARVSRDALEAGDAAGLQYSHRLIVILDDGSRIPLTRGFSGLYSKKLDQIVKQVHEHIGHNTTMT